MMVNMTHQKKIGQYIKKFNKSLIEKLNLFEIEKEQIAYNK